MKKFTKITTAMLVAGGLVFGSSAFAGMSEVPEQQNVNVLTTFCKIKDILEIARIEAGESSDLLAAIATAGGMQETADYAALGGRFDIVITKDGNTVDIKLQEGDVVLLGKNVVLSRHSINVSHYTGGAITTTSVETKTASMSAADKQKYGFRHYKCLNEFL